MLATIQKAFIALIIMLFLGAIAYASFNTGFFAMPTNIVGNTYSRGELKADLDRIDQYVLLRFADRVFDENGNDFFKGDYFRNRALHYGDINAVGFDANFGNLSADIAFFQKTITQLDINSFGDLNANRIVVVELNAQRAFIVDLNANTILAVDLNVVGDGNFANSVSVAGDIFLGDDLFAGDSVRAANELYGSYLVSNFVGSLDMRADAWELIGTGLGISGRLRVDNDSNFASIGVSQSAFLSNVNVAKDLNVGGHIGVGVAAATDTGLSVTMPSPDAFGTNYGTKFVVNSNAQMATAKGLNIVGTATSATGPSFVKGFDAELTASGQWAEVTGLNLTSTATGDAAVATGFISEVSSIGAGTDNQSLQGNYNRVTVHATGTGVEAYGTYLIMGINTGATINNPTKNQIGLFVNSNMAGTDTGNKRWSIYNASTNTTSGKVFLGLDSVKTFWGTGFDASASFDGSQFDINSAYPISIGENLTNYNPNSVLVQDLNVLGDANIANMTISGVSFTSGGINATGDSNFTNLSASKNSFLSNVNVAKDLNAVVVRATGDSNFANARFSGNLFANNLNISGTTLGVDSNFTNIAISGNAFLTNANIAKDLNVSGNISGTNANWDTAYDHSQDNTQAHSDYLLNNANDATTGTLESAGFHTGAPGNTRSGLICTKTAGSYDIVYGFKNTLTASGSSSKAYGFSNSITATGTNAAAYGLYNYLGSSTNNNMQLRGFQADMNPHDTQVVTHGAILGSRTTTINDPVVEQMGLKIIWQNPGTDASNNRWALYNDSPATDATHKGGKVFLGKDNNPTFWGTGFDASVLYDGTNLVINPKDVGTGQLKILGDLNVLGDVNFVNAGFSGFIFGDGSKLTGISGGSGLPDSTLDSNATASTSWLGKTHSFTSDQNFANLGMSGNFFGTDSNMFGVGKIKSHDANSAFGIGAVALGKGATAFGDYSMAIGEAATASGAGAIALGSGTANGDFSISMVEGTASGIGSVAIIGTASGDNSVAVGNGATASGDGSVTMGFGTTASGDYSLAVGSNRTLDPSLFVAGGEGAIAMGYANFGGSGLKATGTGSIALGYNVQSLAEASVTLGKNLTNYNPNSVLVQDLNVAGVPYFDGNFSIKRETDSQVFVCGIDAVGALTCN